MPMPAAEIERIIKDAIPDAIVELTALVDDDDHWAATVVSEKFRGLTRVKQHQLVNAAFGSRLGGELHALALTTRTP
jgi:stress-induced morphogen